jgi:hypothetical protein
MANSGRFARYYDTKSWSVYGALAGFACACMYQFYRAVTFAIPQDLYVQVFGEVAAGVLGGGALFAIGSAVCNWAKGAP